MSRNSDKLNIVDHRTFEDMQKNNGSIEPNMLHSFKYKNMHKVPETLFDFICMPRKKRKQGQIKKEQQLQKIKRPNLTIAKTIMPKFKGRSRLISKEKITRLKRSIRNFRKLKEAKNEVAGQSELNSPILEDQFQTLPTFETDSIQRSDSKKLDLPSLDNQLQHLSLSETKGSHLIHSRRFRSYCDNCTRSQLKELTIQLLKDLDRFQKRAFLANEIKARAHPRLVLGFREALSRLNINKVKLLILATDCEVCTGERGLDETIEKLKISCQQHNVPYCFSLLRRELAFALKKRAQICCVAILDYDGAQDTYKELLRELDDARKDYKRLTAS